jgi:hypothetical protein
MQPTVFNLLLETHVLTDSHVDSGGDCCCELTVVSAMLFDRN